MFWPTMLQFLFIALCIILKHNLAQQPNITCSDSPLNSYPYCNSNLPINDRVNDLLSRLTLLEKVYLQNSDQGGVPRLGIPTLGHSECNRGTGVSGGNLVSCKLINATTNDFPLSLFPQAINLAGSFSRNLFKRMARAISDEVRAKTNQAIKYQCNNDNGFGIACWAPMINICRDPRWGRCQEGYGEDPLLMSELVREYVPNLQHDPNNMEYLQALSTCKHFDAFSGPTNMGDKDSIVNYRDWKSTYLPAFKACNDAGTSSYMCSYNEINGIPSCGNSELLTEILRDEWGFEGYVTSDCGAVPNIYTSQKSARNRIEAAEHAIKAGCDWIGSCSGPNPEHLFLDLYDGIVNGTIPEQYLDRALKRVLPFWFKLGLVDAGYNNNPWSNLILIDEYNKHKSLTFECAVKSMILLKNSNNILPINFNTNTYKKVAVIGPCANNSVCYTGDYNAVPLEIISPLMELKTQYSDKITINYVAGCRSPSCEVPDDWRDVTTTVLESDIVLYIGGISYEQEREGHDRDYIELPPIQSELFKTVYNASLTNNIPIISILTYGAPVIDNFLFDNSMAVLGAGYGGEMIGPAVISLLNGSYIPSGKTTVTWYKSTLQLPKMSDYNMMTYPGRTYKYLNEKPVYPFGYGLSYTSFKYINMSLSSSVITPCQSIQVNIELINNGKYVADESILIYLNIFNNTYPVDNIRLVNFTRIEDIGINDKINVKLDILPDWMTVIQSYYFNQVIIPGIYQVGVGNNLIFDNKTNKFTTLLKQNFTIVGDETNIKNCE